MNPTKAILIAEGTEPASDEVIIQAWQYLIDTGLVWTLQGWFGRAAQQLITEGTCSPYSS
ncbi:MAG: hypothetical protein VXW76_07275 [Actinomycetota bacterium]|nr:hypothetical protein [Actinomycetota bacterium]